VSREAKRHLFRDGGSIWDDFHGVDLEDQAHLGPGPSAGQEEEEVPLFLQLRRRRTRNTHTKQIVFLVPLSHSLTLAIDCIIYYRFHTHCWTKQHPIVW
jgi:hypothetical protein